ETLFAPRNGGRSSAHLRNGFEGLGRVLWKSPDPDLGQPSVSADGRRAVIGRYNSAGLMTLLERRDDAVVPVASLYPQCVISHVRISPTGDRVAVIQSDLGGLHIVDAATNQRGVRLEVPEVTGFSDVAWLQGGASLAGLVTTHAPRSTAGSAEQVDLWEMTTGR